MSKTIWFILVATAAVALFVSRQPSTPDCSLPQNCLVGKALFLGALRGGLEP